MALQLKRTNVSTNAVFPSAYLRIDDFIGGLRDGTLVVKLNTYVDAASAAGGFNPALDPDMIQLTPTEVQSIRDALKSALYNILAARPAYAGAIAV